MTEMFSLSGQVAIVTGAGRGIGFSIARGLAAAGARVYINDLSPEAAEAACAELRAGGWIAQPLPFDVTDHAGGAAGIDRVVESEGRLDILVNNAGILIRKPIETHNMADWDKVLSVNLDSYYVLSQHAIRYMRAQQSGRIINIASVMGISARPGVVSYVAAKHGVVGITRALAAELGKDGITVNAIAPGWILTEINKKVLTDESFHQLVCNRTPLGRWADPDELAGPAVFLASKAASFVSGHVLVVDGGMTATAFLVPSVDLGLAV